ncbi:ParB/RepB/Spo0J family partition protein [Azohydromonas aeria]|uniref:ParB/RepB/Spo0J family partition protein n=1 Tax=Azohydromonas aeria TaxID=2590212 RepID=UPI0012F994F3|nr:ParB/RepB/Spo0J family partition protein [Azohydromonas aeria]
MSFKHLMARKAASEAANPVTLPHAAAAPAAHAPAPAPAAVPAPTAAAAPAHQARTAPGATLIHGANQRVEAAQARVRQLEAELADRPPLELPLEALDSVPGRRRRLTAEEYAELRENLRHNPLVHPVVVRPRAGGRFEIVSGENRVAVYRELGRTTIRVSVLELGDREVDRAAFFANLLAAPLPDFEKWRGFAREKDSSGATQAELARLAGVPEATLSKLFAFARLPAEVLALIEQRPESIGANCAEELAKVCTTPASVVRAVEAVRLVMEGRLQQRQAAAHVRSAPRALKPASSPVRINAGRFRFAELSVGESAVRVNFSAKVDMARVQARMEALLKEMAAELVQESTKAVQA